MGGKAARAPFAGAWLDTRSTLRGASGRGSAMVARDLGRERVNEIQRARILAAMVEESAKRGAANVTVAHIVARAGVSRRTFYELFEDREDCFLGAFDEGIARAMRHVLDGYGPQADWVERVRTAMTGLLAFLDAEPATGQLLVVGSLGAGAKALERRGEVLARMIALLDEGRSVAKAREDLPPLTAEGIAGGVLSVLHSRLLALPPAIGEEGARSPKLSEGSLLDLVGPLMAMIVLPYLGLAAARKELARPIPEPTSVHRHEGNPLGELEMRLTYRTVRVLDGDHAALGGRGSYPSNRAIADAAEVTDQGQMSKLLARLQDIGLIENIGRGAARGRAERVDAHRQGLARAGGDSRAGHGPRIARSGEYSLMRLPVGGRSHTAMCPLCRTQLKRATRWTRFFGAGRDSSQQTLVSPRPLDNLRQVGI